MTDPDSCYGCKTDYCHYAVHNNESEGLCPCGLCIVKSMCDQDCPAFGKWTDSEGFVKALQKDLYGKPLPFNKE